MGRVKVQLQDNIKRFVFIDPDATKGATVGVNLYLPDGTLVTPEMLLGTDDGDDDGGNPDPAITYWRLIREIPNNIIALAALTGQGYAFRREDGTWQLRRSGRAVVPFAYGDASPAEIYIPAEDSHFQLARVVIDTPFDGVGAELTLGNDGDPDAYMAASEIDPSVAASYDVAPDVTVSTGQAVSLTITPGAGATAGAGRVLIDMIPLSES